jgi:diguanylate cyclase (GGDEF)-like protein
VTQHVVVVDDAETNVAILSAIVGMRPETVAHAFTSSREALAFAAENDVDAFVLDYNMPSPDGREVIEHLRRDPRFQFAPIIIVTADSERGNRLAALLAGANDYIERPVEPRELLARLDTLLALHAARQRLADDVSALTQSLRIEEDHSRWQADRMVALWRIVSNPDLTTDDMIHAILREGARAIRAGHRFAGTLMREDGADVVIEAEARQRARPVGLPGVGARVPIADTVQPDLAGGATTAGWSDVQLDPALANRSYVQVGNVRAAIVTTFTAGRSRYHLQFLSRAPLDQPFRPDDFAYVELLGQFFCGRMQQAWQHDRITYQLAHDLLTGLRNRTQFRLDARAALTASGSGTVAVASLDGFRHINETYGHIIGDALLVEVGAALAERSGDSDIIGRLAGDTFGIFLPGAGREDEARTRLAVYNEAFGRPFGTGDREGKEGIPLSATFGFDLASDGTARIDALLSHADTAVFAAKRMPRGRGRTVRFEAGMESAEAERNRMLEELSFALTRNEFQLYFQPHVNVQTRRVAGAEALIRWNHPTRGIVMPDEFIRFAEQNGSIRAISMWVMQETMRHSELLRAFNESFRLYFNLSALDLTDLAVVGELRAAERRGVHLENIGVEVTETAATHDLGLMLQTVKTMQRLGVRVAIDDFGTGYSSLALLKKLPVDVVKIDRTFVSEVLAGEYDSAISESVISFGRRFGFETLGEGVETEEQLEWLRERGCAYAQGYLITRPLPYDKFLQWLSDYTSSEDVA